MATPLVTSRTTGSEALSDRTTRSITIPAGAVGERIVVVFSCDGAVTCTTPSSPLWTRVGQQSNGSAVTGAVFSKLSASPAEDGLTITTSTAQQATWVVLRVANALEIVAAFANGSSTNSNPPLLQTGLPPTSSYRLWVATRSGDSTVVATASPINFGNLTTQQAPGTGSASTSTAENVGLGSELDPTAFTSATEQWVCATLLLYTLEAERDVAADYSVLATAARSLAVGYAVGGVAILNGTWFSRLTNGYNTWEMYGAAALVAENNLTANYGVLKEVAVSAPTASYAVSAPPVGTGIIDGSADMPIAVLWDVVSQYSAATSLTKDRNATYQIMAYATRDLAANYTLAGRVWNDLIPEYAIALYAINDLSGTYRVAGIVGSVQNDRAATFNVLASANNDREASYYVLTAISNDRTASYETLAPISNDRSALWEVAATPGTASNNLLGTYGVTAAVSQDGIGTYDVLSAVAEELTGEWSVWLGAEKDVDVVYQVVVAPVLDLSVDYAVVNIVVGNQIVDLYRYGEAEVDR